MASTRVLSAQLRRQLAQSASHARLPPRAARSASTFSNDSPSPPRLPPEQQAEFERLQRTVFQRLIREQTAEAAAAAAASSASTPGSASSSSSTSASSTTSPPARAQGTAAAPPTLNTAAAQKDDRTVAAGGVWRGAPPEFEGDTNPKTGEVGGPKVEPLRWGGKGDWSYNGRVTDF